MLDFKKKFDNWLALKITNAVSTMTMAYIFALLSLSSFPAVLVLVIPSSAHLFPHWILKTSIIALIAWIAQNFLQLVLLPIIMVGQKLQADSTITHVKKIHKHFNIQ